MRGALRASIFAAVLAVLTLVSADANAREWAGLGPMVTRNQTPLSPQNLPPPPRRAEVPPEGTLEAG